MFLHSYCGFVVKYPEDNRVCSFGGARGSPSDGTSPGALNCFGIWVRSNGADVLDFDFCSMCLVLVHVTFLLLE